MLAHWALMPCFYKLGCCKHNSGVPLPASLQHPIRTSIFLFLPPCFTFLTHSPITPTFPNYNCCVNTPTQRMNLIIKGDTSGVVEAIKGALQALPQESVVLRYLLSAAGDITTSDVDLAAASGGMVVGFNLNPDEGVLAHAKQLGECSRVWG